MSPKGGSDDLSPTGLAPAIHAVLYGYELTVDAEWDLTPSAKPPLSLDRPLMANPMRPVADEAYPTLNRATYTLQGFTRLHGFPRDQIVAEYHRTA